MADTPAEKMARQHREKVQEIGDRFLSEWVVTAIKQAVTDAYEAGRAAGRADKLRGRDTLAHSGDE